MLVQGRHWRLRERFCNQITSDVQCCVSIFDVRGQTIRQCLCHFDWAGE